MYCRLTSTNPFNNHFVITIGTDINDIHLNDEQFIEYSGISFLEYRVPTIDQATIYTDSSFNYYNPQYTFPILINTNENLIKNHFWWKERYATGGNSPEFYIKLVDYRNYKYDDEYIFSLKIKLSRVYNQYDKDNYFKNQVINSNNLLKTNQVYNYYDWSSPKESPSTTLLTLNVFSVTNEEIIIVSDTNE